MADAFRDFMRTLTETFQTSQYLNRSVNVTDFEAIRASNIAGNKALLKELQLEDARYVITGSRSRDAYVNTPAVKRRKFDKPIELPSRTSARIASLSTKRVYSEEKLEVSTGTSAPRIKAVRRALQPARQL